MKEAVNQNITVNDINIIDIAKQNGYVETAKLFEVGIDEFCKETNDLQLLGICGD